MILIEVGREESVFSDLLLYLHCAVGEDGAHDIYLTGFGGDNLTTLKVNKHNFLNFLACERFLYSRLFLVIYQNFEVFLESEGFANPAWGGYPVLASFADNDAANAGSALLLLAEDDTYSKVSGEITLVGPDGCEWIATDSVDDRPGLISTS